MNLDFIHVDGVRDDHEVKLFTLSTCGQCKRAKEFMNNLGMAYEYIDVDLCTRDEKREITQFLKDNNMPISFPVIVIDEKIINGFRSDELYNILKNEDTIARAMIG